MEIKKFGKTKQRKQRFRCRQCKKTFVWKEPHVKKYNEQHWFKLWITESYSVRRLCQLSGYSRAKLQRINQYWLNQEPEKQLTDLSQCKTLIYDGTYFHKDGCFICLMDAVNQRIMAHIYADREGFNSAHPWLTGLKDKGLNPDAIAMDGEISVLRAIRMTWPRIKIQRCLYHIQREGMRWLRSQPKTEAGRELRILLSTLCLVKNIKERNAFIKSFRQWLNQYNDLAQSLPGTNIALKDLKRTVVLINNALPDMFRYIKNPLLPATTNVLESFYSRLKADYRRHRGLSQKNKINYLKWYCHYKNSNIL